MSISSVTSSTNPYPNFSQSGFAQRAQDFKALQSALQSGDLSGAQAAFASLQQASQNSPQPANGSGASGQSNTISSDFASLQSALQSGDINSAQQAFATLQSDFKSAAQAHRRGHHHHHHHSSNSDAGTAVQTSTASTAHGSAASDALGSVLNAQA